MPVLNSGYRLNGKYQLETLIGEGGSSEVWLVRNLDIPERRAAKVFVPKYGDEQMQMSRFNEEYQTAQKLSHPHLLLPDHYEIDKSSASGNRPFMLMDYCEGGDLAGYAARRHKTKEHFTEREIAIVMQQVAGAVAALHQRGTVHGDVKPKNVLLKQPDRLYCMLTDFGSTTSLQGKHEEVSPEPQTMPLSQIQVESREEPYTVHQAEINDFHITPEYAAPEVMTEREATARSDVYSLGVLLYELAAGIRPQALQNGSTHPSDEAAAGLPVRFSDKLDYIIRRCLDPDPAQRQFSALDLSEMAEDYLEDGSWPLIRPHEEAEPANDYRAPTDWERVLRILIWLLLIAGIIGAGWWWWQRRTEAPPFPYHLALSNGTDSIEYLAYAPQQAPGEAQEVSLLRAWRGEPRPGEWNRLNERDGLFYDSTYRIVYEGNWELGVPDGEGTASFIRTIQIDTIRTDTVSRIPLRVILMRDTVERLVEAAYYEGEWEKGQIEGEGRLELYPPMGDTTVVEGVFEEGRLGEFHMPMDTALKQAVLQLPEGSWEGNPVNREDWLIEGYGRGIMRNISDTVFYEGFWKDGLPDGQGTGVFRSGDSTVLACRGIWLKGALNGPGECLVVHVAGDSSLGRFVGKMEGSKWMDGTYTYPNGQEFEGTFVDSKPDSGMYILGPNAYFRGLITDDRLTGKLYQQAGYTGVFEGTWEKGLNDNWIPMSDVKKIQ